MTVDVHILWPATIGPQGCKVEHKEGIVIPEPTISNHTLWSKDSGVLVQCWGAAVLPRRTWHASKFTQHIERSKNDHLNCHIHSPWCSPGTPWWCAGFQCRGAVSGCISWVERHVYWLQQHLFQYHLIVLWGGVVECWGGRVWVLLQGTISWNGQGAWGASKKLGIVALTDIECRWEWVRQFKDAKMHGSHVQPNILLGNIIFSGTYITGW